MTDVNQVINIDVTESTLINNFDDDNSRELDDENYTFLEEDITNNTEDILDNTAEINSKIEQQDNEIIKENLIQEITENKTNTPIKKLLDFIKKPIREDNSEIIESMIELSSTIGNIGTEAHELTKILSETEQIRLKMLQEQSKLGLNEDQFPIGKRVKNDVISVAFVYTPNLRVNLLANEFSQILEDINFSDVASSKNLIAKAKNLHKILEQNEIDPKILVLNQNQKKSYFKIIYNDDRISRTEFEYILNFMKSSAFANSSIIKKRDEYYKALNNGEEAEFPDIKPLINDVKKLKNILNVKLEDLSSYMTPAEKKDLEKFLPALDEYYKDQINAFSGGKCYLPLAKNLKIIQEEIQKNPGVDTLIENCKSLGFTMQRLYILHWIAESMMKKSYKTTLGIAIRMHIEKFPEKETMYFQLRQAVFFRNNIAHNGVIWEPNDFERHIENYEFGINLIANDLNINLKEFQLQKMNKIMTSIEIEEEVCKKLGLKKVEIQKIDSSLLLSINSNKHKRLEEIVRILELNKINITQLINDDLNLFNNVYFSSESAINETKQKFSNNYFNSKFANKYFNRSFEDLITSVLNIQKTAEYKKVKYWLSGLAKKEKEGRITNDDIQTINDLRRRINGQ